MSGCVLVLVLTLAQFGQSNTGELRLTVVDASGLPLQSSIELVSEANQLRESLETDPQGILTAKRLPFGTYRVAVTRDGFATFAGLVEVRLALPTEYHVTLGLAPVQARVTVKPEDTLLDPHDQRHTVRGRISDQITPSTWVALAASYGSGLPVALAGDRAQAIAQYGERIVDRVDFDSGRVGPSFSLDASAGITLAKANTRTLRLEFDVRNLTDRLNVINFAGLFSGTALAAPRSLAVRLQAAF